MGKLIHKFLADREAVEVTIVLLIGLGLLIWVALSVPYIKP